MNDRIKELIQRATGFTMSVYEVDGTRTWGERTEVFDKEKFAELIVKECAEAAIYGRQGILSRFGFKHVPAMHAHSVYGDLYDLNEWDLMVETGAINSDDGSGVWATATEQSDVSVWEGGTPEWATHVMWFNK